MSEDDDVARQLKVALSKAQQEVATYAASSRDRIRAAAVHEAAHAVVGAINDERIGDIVLCPPVEGQAEWGGHTVRDPGSATLNQQVQAALAGDAVEGSEHYGRDERKALEVLGSYEVDEAEKQDYLNRGWNAAQGLVDVHRGAIDDLAGLIADKVEAGKHRRVPGRIIRKWLGELLDRDIGQPNTGDSEPCDCGAFQSPE